MVIENSKRGDVFMVPRAPHERFYSRGPRGPPVPPEEEPTHGEIFDAIMDLRERLERIESTLKRQ